jgi:two-component system NtrC family sensor kinase
VLLEDAHQEVLRGNGEKILVVEDDNGVRDHLSEMLTDMNYSVSAADNAEAALRIIADGSQRIDLMLTDVVMPGMNGRQLVDRALAERPRLRVLFMTGYPRDAIVHAGRLDSDVVLVQKPISPAELSLRLKTMLNGRRASKFRT